MAIDEMKPPLGWCVEQQGKDCWVGVQLNGATDYCTTEEAALSEAHRIAREEAQPYIAEALERIAYWIGSYDMAAEWRAEDADCHEVYWLRRQILAMVRGERQLP